MQKHLDHDTLKQRLALTMLPDAAFKRALTHCSSGDPLHMERLEFLGDAVLGLVIAEYLHHQYPNKDEGHLTRLRAHLVCRASLLQIANAWQLADYLRVGEGERDGHGILKSPSIAANAVEAIIGATFKTLDFEASRALILRAWQFLFDALATLDTTDAKSRLQEWTQGHGKGLPHYHIHDLGPQKDPRFQALCQIKGKTMGNGWGNRKKHAELTAAEQAIIELGFEKNKGNG
ncbi:MAG: ribonuclease III [Mariprofundaceae bacterium]|nr:ribonuclease III [Mariprofundaceae bacterium]